MIQFNLIFLSFDIQVSTELTCFNDRDICLDPVMVMYFILKLVCPNHVKSFLGALAA